MQAKSYQAGTGLNRVQGLAGGRGFPRRDPPGDAVYHSHPGSFASLAQIVKAEHHVYSWRCGLAVGCLWVRRFPSHILLHPSLLGSLSPDGCIDRVDMWMCGFSLRCGVEYVLRATFRTPFYPILTRIDCSAGTYCREVSQAGITWAGVNKTGPQSAFK